MGQAVSTVYHAAAGAVQQVSLAAQAIYRSTAAYVAQRTAELKQHVIDFAYTTANKLSDAWRWAQDQATKVDWGMVAGIGAVVGGVTGGVGAVVGGGVGSAVGSRIGSSVATSVISNAAGGAVAGPAGYVTNQVLTGQQVTTEGLAGSALAGGVVGGIAGGVGATVGAGKAGACSFTGDTPVRLGDGSLLAISAVGVGTVVSAMDPATGGSVSVAVEGVSPHIDQVWDMVFSDGAVVESTANHPWWIASERAFVRTDHIDPGDVVVTAEGGEVSVVSVTQTDQWETTYNLTVGGPHTYMVGDTSILVHNCPVTVPDSDIVVRGGMSDIPDSGVVFSGSHGSTVSEAASGVPHGQIRVTTAGEIRSGRGSVTSVPEPTRSGMMNEKHVDICLGVGSCPFGSVEPNPVPKSGRVN